MGLYRQYVITSLSKIYKIWQKCFVFLFKGIHVNCSALFHLFYFIPFLMWGCFDLSVTIMILALGNSCSCALYCQSISLIFLSADSCH